MVQMTPDGSQIRIYWWKFGTEIKMIKDYFGPQYLGDFSPTLHESTRRDLKIDLGLDT